MLPEPTDPRGRVEREAARVVSRLAALGPRRLPADMMRSACTELAGLAWAAERLPGRPPTIDVAPHAWPDVLRVLVSDLLAASPEPDHVGVAADLLTTLRHELP